jgi:ATP-dependent NAD(P)H-hydrate dehydratase
MLIWKQECSRLAFAKRGRSLQASDLTEEVHTAFLNLFGEIEESELWKL